MASNGSARGQIESEDRKDKKRKRKHSAVGEESPTSKQQKASAENGKDESETNESSSWTHEKEQVLFDRVEEFLITFEPTRKIKTVFPRHIVWESIKFDDFSAESCKKRWSLLSTRVRKMRSAKEILDDARRLHLEEKLKAKKKAKTVLPVPGQPKRPLTAFFLYIQAKRATVVEKYPDLKASEVMQRLSNKWKKLPEKKKQKYQRRYEIEKAVFDEKLTSFLIESHPEMEPPKSAYELWGSEEKNRIVEQKGEMSEKKMTKKIQRHWENLDDLVKTAWEEKAKKELKKFKSRIAKEGKKAKLKAKV